VFLVIMLISFGLAATQAARFNWEDIRDEINIDDEDFTLFGHNYSYDDQLQQAFPAGATLRINNLRGAVNVIDSGDDQIHVKVHKRINAENEGDADKWNTGTKPQITSEGRNLTLNANNEGAGQHRVTIDLEISIPRKAPVIISTRNGDVSVTGREGDVN